MKDKNKKELENIVRRDDSGNEIEPLNDGISKQFYNLLGIFLEKSGRAEKPNPTHDFELLKEHRLQARNDFITERIERRKANGANIGEDYYRRLEALWIEKEFAIVDKWIDENKNRSIPISEIDDVNDHLTEYKKYLEQLKNPAKPDGEKYLTEITQPTKQQQIVSNNSEPKTFNDLFKSTPDANSALNVLQKHQFLDMNGVWIFKGKKYHSQVMAFCDVLVSLGRTALPDIYFPLCKLLDINSTNRPDKVRKEGNHTYKDWRDTFEDDFS